ncbi:Hypothetical protein ACI5QM_03080 [Bacillus subtilis]
MNLRSDYWRLTASEFGLGLERIFCPEHDFKRLIWLFYFASKEVALSISKTE